MLISATIRKKEKLSHSNDLVGQNKKDFQNNDFAFQNIDLLSQKRKKPKKNILYIKHFFPQNT